MKWLEKIQKIDILLISGKFNMKVIILCGGLGSRLGEETKLIPKPMIKLGTKPIVNHIMDIYIKMVFYIIQLKNIIKTLQI